METAARTAPAAVIVAIDGPAGTGKSSTSRPSPPSWASATWTPAPSTARSPGGC
ncbi:hypothetical protein NKH77_12550 [Streptomyces sp. M19]